MINIQTIHAAKNGDEDAMQQIFREFKQLILLKTKIIFSMVLIRRMYYKRQQL